MGPLLEPDRELILLEPIIEPILEPILEPLQKPIPKSIFKLPLQVQLMFSLSVSLGPLSVLLYLDLPRFKQYSHQPISPGDSHLRLEDPQPEFVARCNHSIKAHCSRQALVLDPSATRQACCLSSSFTSSDHSSSELHL